MHLPRNDFKSKLKKPFTNLNLYAIYVKEKIPIKGEEPLSWMLVTNISISSFEEVIEKIEWYGLRWRIEDFHKVLK